MPLREFILIDESLYTDGGSVAVQVPDTFVTGISGGIARRGTPPSAFNTGNIEGVALSNYSGPNAGGELVISVAGTTYTNVNFGNTRVDVRAPNVKFINCKWTCTNPDDESFFVDFRNAGNTGGGYMYRCSVENVSQIPSGITGVGGWNVTIERCKVWGFVDNMGFYIPGSSGDAPINVLVLDCWLGPMAFYAYPTGGTVHSSDTKTHNDGIQFQGGYGWRVINTTIIGHYSTVVGTGTPNSGSVEAGHTGYSQAAGESQRYAIVEGSGEFSLGQPGALLGGSIAGIMVSPAAGKGVTQNAEVSYCYGSGGSYWLNAGTDSLEGDFGEVKGLRIINDQRHSDYAIVVDTGVTVTTSDNFWAVDGTSWASTGTGILRRTG